MDPFGNYVAEIQEGLNDAFDGPSSPKGIGEYGAKEEASAQPRAERPSAVSPFTAPEQPEGTSTAGDASAAAPPLENGDSAVSELPAGADAAPPAATDQGAMDAAVAVRLPPPISVAAVLGEQGPEGAATPLHAAPGTATKAAATDTVLQKDAFLVFRALCKLSIRTADASSGTDLTAIRGKVCPQDPSFNVKYFNMVRWALPWSGARCAAAGLGRARV